MEVRLDPSAWVVVSDGDDHRLYRPAPLRGVASGHLAEDGSAPFVRCALERGRVTSVTACPGGIGERSLFVDRRDAPALVDRPSRGDRFDPRAALQVLCFGYALGSRTLWPGVTSLPPGEVTTIDDRGAVVDAARVYNGVPWVRRRADDWIPRIEELAATLGAEAAAAVGDRTVLLPLSGGYDSRAVLALLLRAGVRDIRCFAWGKEGNVDVEVSRRIAERLALPWTRVDYRPAAWEAALAEGVFDGAMEASSCGRGISGVASLPFQRHLIRAIEQGTIDPGRCVMALGHSGDFLAGSHLHDTLRVGDDASAVAKILMERHRLTDCAHVPALQSEIRTAVDDLVPAVGEPWRALEAWDAQERQAKFIVQTNRYYERFGLGWTMPLWDPRFVGLWQTVGPGHRRQLALYDRWLEEGPFAALDIRVAEDARRRKRPWVGQLRGRLLRVPPVAALAAARRRSRPPGDEFGFNSFGPRALAVAEGRAPEAAARAEALLRAAGVSGAKNAYAHVARAALLGELAGADPAGG